MLTDFAPLRFIDGYLPLEDHGLIGDGTTAALVGRDGVISWLCVPRFDSRLLCGARLAERFGLPGDAEGWRAEAERIRQAIRAEAWDAEVNALTAHLGGGGLDASLLALPLRRVIAADHPRMVATTAAIGERLGAGDGLLYRYRPDESPDGLPGHEGAFVLCSFWLVDNLAPQGRLDEAMDLFDALCARANPLGLLPEQSDRGSGAFLGNDPQAFSQGGLTASGLNPGASPLGVSRPPSRRWPPAAFQRATASSSQSPSARTPLRRGR